MEDITIGSRVVLTILHSHLISSSLRVGMTGTVLRFSKYSDRVVEVAVDNWMRREGNSNKTWLGCYRLKLLKNIIEDD